MKNKNLYIVQSLNEANFLKEYLNGDITIYADYLNHTKDDATTKNAIFVIRDIRSIIVTEAINNNSQINLHLHLFEIWEEYVNHILNNNLKYIRVEDIIVESTTFKSSYKNYNWIDSLSPSQNNRICKKIGGKLFHFNYQKFCSEPLPLKYKKSKKELLGSVETGHVKLSIPAELRKGSLQSVEVDSVKSGKIILDYVKKIAGISNYNDLDILDYGCGVKFSQAILQFNIPVKSYTGVDLDKDMINFLQQNVDKKNMHYHSVSFQNDLYNNESSAKMNENTELPLDCKYDVMLCQSVFTHLDPSDFLNLLKILKKYSKPTTLLFFTCFIDNLMKHDFKDINPKLPLIRIFFKEELIEKMIVESGWHIVKKKRRDPYNFVGDHFLCKPSTK